MNTLANYIVDASKYPTAWLGHGKFAIQLVTALQPKTIVDLGVDYGFSTFCFAYPKIGYVWGVDCFEGDPQAGMKNTYPLVIGQRARLRQKYGIHNVNIVKGYFNDVAKDWETKPDPTIDILHIDGLHTYDAVSEDFRTWSKFLSPDGVVLFHDTISYRDDVGRFFDELPGDYKVNFEHSFGLGVWTSSQSTYAKLQQIVENYGEISL